MREDGGRKKRRGRMGTRKKEERENRKAGKDRRG